MFSAFKHFAHLGDITDVELASGFTVRQFAIFSLPQPFYINMRGLRQETISTTVVNEK